MPPSSDAAGVLILANPYHGAERPRRVVAALVAALRRRGLEPIVTWRADAFSHAVGEDGFAEWCRCIVAAGGDGTFHHVINTALEVPLAVLPLGLENLVARQYGYSDDPAALAATIELGQTRAIDLGQYGRHRFAIVASAGFDGAVAHRLDAWRRRGRHVKRVNRFTYAYHIARSILRYRHPVMQLTADGQTHRGSLVMVFNLPRYGFDMKLCPMADDADGLLDWLVFERPGSLPLARYAWALFTGARHLDMPDVHHGRARNLRIDCDRPVPLEVDGEAADHIPITLQALPRAATLLRPC